MGWASGNTVFSRIIEGVQDAVADKETRKAIYRPIIEAFEDADWDTQNECEGEDVAYDEVLREMHPDWFEDED